MWVRMLVLGLDSGRVMVVDEATGDNDDWKIWDAASGELHRVVATHDGPGAHIRGLRAVAFSPCGQRLATSA